MRPNGFLLHLRSRAPHELGDVAPCFALEGLLTSRFGYYLGFRRDEIGFDNVDLLVPAHSFNCWIGVNSPKATLSFFRVSIRRFLSSLRVAEKPSSPTIPELEAAPFKERWSAARTRINWSRTRHWLEQNCALRSATSLRKRLWQRSTRTPGRNLIKDRAGCDT
jgi:hypothetical protein